MSLRVKAAKNVSATWLSLAVHAVVGFFLAPFVLHRLGDDALSLWVLVFSLTGYYGLLDLGIRASIVRYVAKFAATGEEQQLTKFVSTSLAFYVAIGLVVLLLAVVGFFYLPVFFHIPPSLLGTTRVLFLLGGAVGTAIPLTCTGLFFLPRRICRQLQIPLRAFLTRTYLLPLALCIPLAGVLVFFLQHEFPAHSYSGLTLEVACGGAVYCTAFCLTLFAVRPVNVNSWKALTQVLDYNQNARSGGSSWAL